MRSWGAEPETQWVEGRVCYLETISYVTEMGDLRHCAFVDLCGT